MKKSYNKSNKKNIKQKKFSKNNRRNKKSVLRNKRKRLVKTKNRKRLRGGNPTSSACLKDMSNSASYDASFNKPHFNSHNNGDVGMNTNLAVLLNKNQYYMHIPNKNA